jgi:hypothetical protein
MWYESKMLNETLDSLQCALQNCPVPIDLEFCFNSQTYIETPIEGESKDMFNEFINHPVLKNAKILYKKELLNPLGPKGFWNGCCIFLIEK